MIRVLIAPDKFKGTLSAAEAARAMRDGALAAAARLELDIDTTLRPLADGGEGSHDCLRELGAIAASTALNLREERAGLADPNGHPRPVPYLSSVAKNRGGESQTNDRTTRHYLETALAIGLTLPGARDASILDRTTRGVGEWLAARVAEYTNARNAGSPARALKLHLFLGGSATSDGGFGLARALGFRFRSAHDNAADEIRHFRDILQARRVEAPANQAGAPATGDDTGHGGITVHVYTDVQNPLDGPDGAARLFGPQKGASAEEVAQLEQRLVHLGDLFEDMRTRNPQARGEALFRRPGAGAAGGLALPLLYWPGVEVRFRSGIDFFLEAAGVDEAIRGRRADCVISGEGATDRGSLQGKVVAGLGRLCGVAELNDNPPESQTPADSMRPEPHPPLLIVSGSIPDEERGALVAAGYKHLYDTNSTCGRRWPLAPQEAAERLRATTAIAVSEFLTRTTNKNGST